MFTLPVLRLGTRASPLALWQAEFVRAEIRARLPGQAVEIIPMTTQGDRRLDVSLGQIGGKGLFTKELEDALFDERVDLAVHSLKDVTVSLPDGLELGAILAREDPRDALVTSVADRLAGLPAGARVGTSSLRRQSQIRERFPALTLMDVRGNVGSRLARLDTDDPLRRLDAVVLAAAGLKRLGLGAHIRALLSFEESLPAVGQGAIALENRQGDRRVAAALAAVHDPVTGACVTAERAMNRALGGSCQLPIAGLALSEGNDLYLRGLVATVSGDEVVRAQARGAPDRAQALGETVARALLDTGADRILARLTAP